MSGGITAAAIGTAAATGAATAVGGMAVNAIGGALMGGGDGGGSGGSGSSGSSGMSSTPTAGGGGLPRTPTMQASKVTVANNQAVSAVPSHPFSSFSDQPGSSDIWAARLNKLVVKGRKG